MTLVDDVRPAASVIISFIEENINFFIYFIMTSFLEPSKQS